MIQLLIGIGFVLGIFTIVFLFGLLIIFLNNNFTKNYEYYDWYNILNFGGLGFGVFLVIIVAIIVIWGIGDIILISFK